MRLIYQALDDTGPCRRCLLSTLRTAIHSHLEFLRDIDENWAVFEEQQSAIDPAEMLSLESELANIDEKIDKLLVPGDRTLNPTNNTGSR